MGESPKVKLVIPSKLSELVKVQDAVLKAARDHGYGKDELFAIRLSLDEAVSNAIQHGNRQDLAKRVTIEYTVDNRAVRIEVSDEGCGFCRDHLPDPTHEENLATPRGRGIMLIRAYMSEASYNKAGNRISMVKCKGCKLPNQD